MSNHKKIHKLSKSQKVIKRLFDLIFGITLFVFVAPVLLLISLVIKLTSPGPILYRQQRVGLDGKIFNVYKFRTMTLHAENMEIAQWAKEDDARVTFVGSILRRTALDEIPQIINVIKGDMSIVGPRSQRPFFYEKFKEEYSHLQEVKPGITGWAQINSWRGDTDNLSTLENNIRYDTYYIDRWSLWFDLKILLLTIGNAFGRGNAY